MKIQPEEQYKFLKISLPDGVSANEHSVLLHACCAPCSAAIVECMLRNGIRPTVYFSNSNIFPQQEFDIRKQELIRFLQQQDVPYVEDEYDHADWKKAIAGLENEPERGSRCSCVSSIGCIMQPAMPRRMVSSGLLLRWLPRAGRTSDR